MTDSRAFADSSIRPAGAWLLFVVFLAGGALMAYEIVGSRLLAPYFGSSTYVWGSLIGVFLGALATGYAVGGRLSDLRPAPGALAGILAASSVLMAISVLASDPLQRWIVEVDFGTRMNPLIASILLFGPASILIGMVSPYAVRLRAGDIDKVGRTAGSLYGLSTAGSIVGTLAASFWLVQSFGSDATILAVACVLAGCALLTSFAGRARAAAGVASVFAAVAVTITLVSTIGEDVEGTKFTSVGSDFSPVYHSGGYRPDFEPSEGGTLRAQADSSYHRIRVVDYGAGEIGNRPARVLHFDNSLQAAAPLDAKNNPVTTGPPLFGYLRAFDLVPAIQRDADRVLFIGLGSGAAAMRLRELDPDVRIDVVEIDPKVVDYARKWFGYRDTENGDPRTHTHVSDGRTWLAAQDDDVQFDAVVVDAYFADSIPFHLTTREFLKTVRSHLTDDGIAMANLIGAVEGPRSDLIRAMHRTWADVFEDVVVYPVPAGNGQVYLDQFQNVEFLAGASRGTVPPRGGEAALVERLGTDSTRTPVLDDDLRALLDARYTGDVSSDTDPVLTDDRAPVDALLSVEE